MAIPVEAEAQISDEIDRAERHRDVARDNARRASEAGDWLACAAHALLSIADSQLALARIAQAKLLDEVTVAAPKSDEDPGRDRVAAALYECDGERA